MMSGTPRAPGYRSILWSSISKQRIKVTGSRNKHRTGSFVLEAKQSARFSDILVQETSSQGTYREGQGNLVSAKATRTLGETPESLMKRTAEALSVSRSQQCHQVREGFQKRRAARGTERLFLRQRQAPRGAGHLVPAWPAWDSLLPQWRCDQSSHGAFIFKGTGIPGRKGIAACQRVNVGSKRIGIRVLLNKTLLVCMISKMLLGFLPTLTPSDPLLRTFCRLFPFLH